jgi:predicted nucleic acid-binding protein
MESEAVLRIISIAKSSGWTIAGSEVIETEMLRISNLDKLAGVVEFYDAANEYLRLDENVKLKAEEYQKHHINLFDSLHLATAEENGYDLFFTTDYDFCRDAQTLRGLSVKVYNPLVWYTEVYCNGYRNG